MAEYVMGPDESNEDVSRSLIEHAGPERAHEIAWYPRPGVPGGGVFYMPDDLAEGYSSDRVFRMGSEEDAAKGDGDAERPEESTAHPTTARSRRAARAQAADQDNAKG